MTKVHTWLRFIPVSYFMHPNMNFQASNNMPAQIYVYKKRGMHVVVVVVVVVFYWPLGSKQISMSLYIRITHTHMVRRSHFPYKRHCSHWLGLIFFQLRLYMRFKSIFFYIPISRNFMKRASPIPALGPRKFPGTRANSGPAWASGTRSVTVDRHMRKYRNGQQQ